MKKTEWIEEHKKEIENYDKSMLSHDDDTDSMKDYEFSILHHDDDCQMNSDDWYEPMGHFKD